MHLSAHSMQPGGHGPALHQRSPLAEGCAITGARPAIRVFAVMLIMLRLLLTLMLTLVVHQATLLLCRVLLMAMVMVVSSRDSVLQVRTVMTMRSRSDRPMITVPSVRGRPNLVSLLQPGACVQEGAQEGDPPKEESASHLGMRLAPRLTAAAFAPATRAKATARCRRASRSPTGDKQTPTLNLG